MGNQPSCEDQRHCELSNSAGAVRRSIKVHLSEEDYLPMTLAMKQSLLGKKKFERVVPSNTFVEESKRNGKQDIETNQSDQLDRGSKQSERHLSQPLQIERDDEDFFVLSGVRGSPFHVEPVVTVMDVPAVENEPKWKFWPGDVEEKTTIERLSETFKKSPTTTNRRFSLIDLNTGIKKSKFTLELEDRLRQSKIELGFDNELDNWKEFNYALGIPENKKKGYLVHGERTKSSSLKSVNSRTKHSSPNEPLQYCDHKCQILGLCSVGRPEVMPTLEPPIFNNEISWKYDVTQSMRRRQDELNGLKKHPKRDDCTCDVCTLAYLTSMDVPGDCDRRLGKVRGRSVEEKQGDGSDIRERIKIIHKGDLCKSVEVNVSTGRGYIKNSSSSRSNTSSTSNEEDTTNYRIKKKFKNNSPTAFINAYSNYNHSLKDISIVDLPTVDEGATRPPSNTRIHSGQSAYNNWTMNSSNKSDTRQSSTSTLGASVSSSLSTIMSYKRVRQIFQTIIEKNRPRKRARRNIHKFKEMEDLGLGELKNNRWYPSDSKTFSIWRDMHSSMQGVQAQFKKYHRVSSRSKTER